jgi:hypothetical protein
MSNELVNLRPEGAPAIRTVNCHHTHLTMRDVHDLLRFAHGRLVRMPPYPVTGEPQSGQELHRDTPALLSALVDSLGVQVLIARLHSTDTFFLLSDTVSLSFTARSKDFRDSLKGMLAPADRYPAQSLPLYILQAFAQFLPALLMPCSRRCKPRHLSINTCRFQKGEWEALWTQTLHHNNREVAHRAKRLDGKPPTPCTLRGFLCT